MGLDLFIYIYNFYNLMCDQHLFKISFYISMMFIQGNPKNICHVMKIYVKNSSNAQLYNVSQIIQMNIKSYSIFGTFNNGKETYFTGLRFWCKCYYKIVTKVFISLSGCNLIQLTKFRKYICNNRSICKIDILY